MIYLQGGPVGLTIFIVMILAIGGGAVHVWHMWLRWRAESHARQVHFAKNLKPMIDETRRLLDQDQPSVNNFIDTLGRELLAAFPTATWHKDLTLADLRNHVECAVFDLIQGCHCGNCSGISNGGSFWIEARYAEFGVSLHAMVRREIVGAAIMCAPVKLRTTPHPDYKVVTMVCDCGTPVVTSIDHIAEGKKPLCAVCVTGGPRA